MKNMNVLSFLTLLAFTQIYGDVNPDLSFVFAYQAIDELNKSIASDNDDITAVRLLKVMSDCIDFDVQQQKALDEAKNTYLYNGVPLDLDKIAAEDKDLQDKINSLNSNIKDFEKGGVTAVEKKKVDNRRNARNQAQNQLDANLAAIKDNQAAMTTAQQAQAQIATLRAKNALALEQAIESYISSFGQAYVKPGTSLIVISSKYDQNLPITPKVYQQLSTILNNAYNQFGSDVMISLALANSASLSIVDVLRAINNMPLSSSSNTSWAMFGLKATVGVGAAILAGGIAYNLYQSKAWNDQSNAQAMSEAAWNKTSETADDIQKWFAENFGA